MSEHKLPQEVREELGLVGVKNRSPRNTGGRWVHQHQYDAEEQVWTSAGQYRNPTRQAVKTERQERRRKSRAYAKQYIRCRVC